MIVLDVIERLLTSDMVLCDLSGCSPNVLYELGIRHAARKPAVLIMDDNSDRIFDIQSIRTFQYSLMARGKQLEADTLGLAKVLKATERAERLLNSPISLLSPGLQSKLEGVRVFSKRDELTPDTGFKDALKTCGQLDLVGLSAEVAITVFKEALYAALERVDFSCRIVIYDPSPRTSIHYEALVANTLKQAPALKRAQAQEVLELAMHIEKKYPGQRKMQLRVIRERPLLFNLWIACDQSGLATTGHISIYSYDYESGHGGPAFRVSVPDAPLLKELQREFNYVWTSVANTPL